MKHRKWIFLVFFIVALTALSGCNLPFDDEQPEDTQAQSLTYAVETLQAQAMIDTIVAQTITALPTIVDEPLPPDEMPSPTTAELTPTDTVTPTSAPTETATLTPTHTATSTPTLNATETPLVPRLEVSVPTNCRIGPGKAYDIVSVLRINKIANVLARHATLDFWVIENPEGAGHCWVWGEYATFSGPINNLPVWDPPPTPTPAVTSTPGVTPTSTGVTLQVSVPTNCRVGPGKAYEIISVLHTGKTANVLARHATLDFWVIENPEGPDHCWVWGEYATLSGRIDNLPVWDPPPTPTPTVTPTPTETPTPTQEN